MNADWQILIRMSLCFVALFAFAELLYHVFRVKTDYTRNIVHAGTGVLTLLFPVYFDHLWQVLVICGAFLGLLAMSLRYKFLTSINAISRHSAGSILYPIVVAITFAFYLQMTDSTTPFRPYIYFYLPILLMAICDPVAALAGNAYKYRHPSTGKTWIGSISFFTVGSILSIVLLNIYFEGHNGMPLVLVYAVAVTGIATFAERITGGGWDNLTIPITTAASLYIISNIAA